MACGDCCKGYSTGYVLRLTSLTIVIVGCILAFTLLANERLNGDFTVGKFVGGMVGFFISLPLIYYLVTSVSFYYMSNVVAYNAKLDGNVSKTISQIQAMTISRNAVNATILWALLWIGFYLTVLVISSHWVLGMGAAFLICAGLGSIFWLIEELQSTHKLIQSIIAKQ